MLNNKGFGVVKNEKDFLVFENLRKLFWIMGLEIIWNINCKSLRQKGTDLLTGVRGKFELWKMAKKNQNSHIRSIDGGHNIVCDVGLNVAVLDVDLRSGDVASSYNGGVSLSSSNVFTNNVGIFGRKWV